MSAIQFVVRDPSGIFQNGSVTDSDFNGNITLSSGSAVSMDLRRLDIAGYMRQGGDLVLLMSDGRKVVLEDYFGPDGNPQAKLYLNEGGHLIETEVSATGTVTHDEVAAWGKWGDLQALTFPSDPVVSADATMVAGNAADVDAAVAATGGDYQLAGTAQGGHVTSEEATMGVGLGLVPLAGFGGTGIAAGAAVLGGAALLGGGAAVAGGTGGGTGGGGVTGGTASGSGSTIIPTIDSASDNYAYNGQSTQSVTITGQAEPGSTVDVTIGTKTVTVFSDATGRWSAEFTGANFPGDGEYNVSVTVTEPTGGITTLAGQTIIVDTTPPDLDVDGFGATVQGQIVNAAEHSAGFTLEGTGEAGASITVLVNGLTRTTTVGTNGTWSVDFANGDFPTGEYDIDVTVRSTDAFNNTSTVVHTMTIDTVAPNVSVDANQTGDNLINGAEAQAGVDITGMAEPGSTVVVTMNGVSYTVTADQAGTWIATFQPGDFPTGEYTATITAVATDLAGNSTTTTSTVAIDTEGAVSIDAGTGAGGETVVNGNAQSGGSVQLTGSTQPGSTVVVTIDGTDYTAVVDGSGNWTVNVPGSSLQGGEYTTGVTVTSTDGSGNTDTTTGTVLVDTETSVAVVAGHGGADAIINEVERDAGVTFSGTGEPGATINVAFANGSYTTTVDGNGDWAVDFAASDIPDGEYTGTMVVAATDLAGNTNMVTEQVTVDTNTSFTAIVDGPGPDGVFNGFEAVAGLTVAGRAEPGAEVSVQIGQTTLPATVGRLGDWSVTFPHGSIQDGEYVANVTVTSTDAAGNVATATTPINIDTVVSDFAFTSDPTGGHGVLSGSELGNTLTLTGTVEPGSSISMTIGNATRPGTVDANGNWSVSFAPGTIPSGEYDTMMTVTATDQAGNIHMDSQMVTVDTEAGDLAISSAPIEIDDIINATERGDGVTINGTSTPGMLVTVQMGNASTTAITDVNGNWSADFAPGQIAPGTYTASITASITDGYGNTKSASESVDVDTIVMNFASNGVTDSDGTVNAVEAADGITLTGTVEPGSTVSVRLGLVTHSATVAANGTWTVDFAAGEVPGGEQDVPVLVTATDGAGNSAMVTDTVTVDTSVNQLAIGTSVGGDGYINAQEAAMGLTLTGVVEAGSSVIVNFDGTSRAASVDAQGNWSVGFAPSEIGTGDEQVNVTISATDGAGNTATVTETAQLDTEAPDAPHVTGYYRSGDDLDGITVYTGDATAEITTLAADGAQGQVETISRENFLNPLDQIDFGFPQDLPNGQHLLITKSDDAGNTSSTLFALDAGLPDSINLDQPGFMNKEIEAIDLRFAENSELTIDSGLLESLSRNSNALTIHGSADDAVMIDTTDGATLSDTNQNVTIGTETYSVYTLGDEGGMLIIDDDITIT